MPRELVAIAPNEPVIREYEENPLQPGQIRIKTEFSAEKHGTSLAFFKGDTPFMNKTWDPELQLFLPRKSGEGLFPMRLGNMSVGVVVAVGQNTKRFKVGDKVFGYLPIRETHTVSEDEVEPVPEGVSYEEVLCIDPATVALMAIREARFSLGDKVAIFGLGAIGLIAVQMAKISGATLVIGIDPIPERRDLAERYGADLTLDPSTLDVGLEIKLATDKFGVDVALECSGSYSALHHAIRGTRYGGTIVPVGVYHGSPTGLDLSEEWHFNRHILISGARVESEPYRDYPRWDRRRVYETVIELFKRKTLAVREMLTVVPFEESPDAYRALAKEPTKWIKLVVRY